MTVFLSLIWKSYTLLCVNVSEFQRNTYALKEKRSVDGVRFGIHIGAISKWVIGCILLFLFC